MVIASIMTAASARPRYAGFGRTVPSVVPAGRVTPHVWALAGRVGPMPTQGRAVRFAVNQTSPPREVILR